MLQAFFPKINRSKIVKKKEGLSIEEEREYLEDFDEEPNVWKRLFNITTEPVWYNFILLMGWYSSTIAFLEACLAIINDNLIFFKRGIFYLCDICFIIDIVLRTGSRYVKNLNTRLISPPAKNWILVIIDLMSVFPIELFVYNNKVYYHLVILNRSLKVFHAVYLFRYINSMVNESVVKYVIELIYLLTYFAFLITTCALGITCSIKPQMCMVGNNESETMSKLIYFLETVSGNLMTTGFGLITQLPNASAFFVVLTSFIVFLEVFCVYSAYISFAFFVIAAHKSDFRFKRNAVCTFFYHKGNDEVLLKLIKKYFDQMWNFCDGYEGYMAETRIEYGITCFKHILPKSMNLEIYTDVCWDAFNHSRLYYKMDVAFKRELSSVTKQQIYIGGQYIFHKNEMKDKFIYVFYGTVQIISPEDEETPLLSLSEGTFLGGSSIVVPYKSNYAVRSSSTCVLQVLERKALLEVTRKYPDRLIFIVNEILKRYRDTITLHEIKKEVNNKPNHLFKKSLSTLWINFTLHKLMGCKDRDSAFTHSVQNVYLQDNVTDDTFKNYLFSADFLSALAITERIELNSDTLFIKSNFPYILKPNTGLVLFFDVAMAILATISALTIPKVILSQDKNEILVIVVVYTFTTIWVLDIFIKLSTAVASQNRIITKRYNILFCRLTDVTFLLDVFSAWPLELFSGFIVWERFASITYLNRMFKTYKVFQLLRRWENHYNSNHLLVRIIGVTLFLFHGIIVFSTIYSFIGCSNDCSGNENFKIVFFVSQILTRASLYVQEYSSFQEYFLFNLFVFLLASVFCVVTYGLIFSAYSFIDYIDSTHRHNNLSLIRLLKRLKLQPLVRRVEKEAALRMITSDGLSSNYIFENIPTPALGHFFKTNYLDWICKIPMFQSVPKYIIVDILQTCASLESLEANTFIYHVGEIFHDLLLLANGECERIFGDTHTYKKLNHECALNSFEVSLGIPARSTVKTETDCDIIKIPYLEMRRVFLKYHIKKYNIGRMIDLKLAALQLKNVSPSPIVFRRENNDKVASFVKHGRLKNRDLIRDYGNVRSCLTKILLSTTFLPNGVFFKYWEIARCVFAIISSILYSTSILSSLSFPHPIAFILLLLDLTAYVDLYIQAHVCYYNEKGIFVTDPYLTFKNYLSSRFLIDFIAALPVHYVITSRRYFYLNITKLLQLHRYIGFTNYKIYSSVIPLSKFFIFQYFPVYLIFLNYFAGIFLNLSCKISDHDDLICLPSSVFQNNKLEETLTPLKAHFYSYFIILSTASTMALQGFSILDNQTMLILGLVSVFAVYWTTSIMGNVFKYFLFEYKKTSSADIQLKRLYEFMASENVKKSLVLKVERHLERCDMLQRINAHFYLKNCSDRIKRDVLFGKYGNILSKICLKNGLEVDQFIRNILIYSRYNVIDKNGYAQTINDVTDEVFILFTGLIEIVAPNGVVMLQLPPGSMFGNLYNMKYNRMKVSVVAQGTLEILKVKTLKFFEILNHFKSTKEEFYKLQQIHVTHIPGYSHFIYPKSMDYQSHSKSAMTMIIAEMVFLTIGSYIGVAVFFYKTGLLEFGFYQLLLDVFCDISFAVSIALGFNKPIYIKWGSQKSPKVLKDRSYKSKLFWLSVMTCIPTEIIPYLLPLDRMLKWYVYVALKICIIIRFIYWYIRVDQLYKSLKTNVLPCKIILTALTALMMMIFLTALLLSTSTVLGLHYKKFRAPIYFNTVWDKFEIFTICLFIICNFMIRFSQYSYYPTTFLLVCLAIVSILFMLIFSSFVYSSTISAVQSTKELKREYLAAVRHLYSYLKKYGASLSMTERVSYYIQVIWLKFYGITYPEILNDLPLYLKGAVLESAFGEIIVCHPVFAKCHVDFRRQILNYLRINYYHNGDYIQFKGIIGNTICWVHFGEVVALSEASDYSDDIVHTFKKGDCFGTPQGLLDEAPYYFSYRAVKYTSILYLVKKDWCHLMPFFPASATTIEEMGRKYFLDEK